MDGPATAPHSEPSEHNRERKARGGRALLRVICGGSALGVALSGMIDPNVWDALPGAQRIAATALGVIGAVFSLVGVGELVLVLARALGAKSQLWGWSSPDASEAIVKQYLAESDVACPSCGHGLRGAAGDRCPECGVAIRVGLKLEVDVGPYAWSVASVAVVFLASVVTAGHSVYWLAFAPRPRGYRFIWPPAWMMTPIVAEMIVMPILAVWSGWMLGSLARRGPTGLTSKQRKHARWPVFAWGLTTAMLSLWYLGSVWWVRWR